MISKRRLASFSLLEMLVAMAVFAILMLVIFGVLDGAIRLWRQQTAREEGFREARAALNTLSRDMNAALISTNTAWFYCNPTNQLAFLSTLPDTAQGSADGSSLAHGDICAIGYSLEWGTNDASGYQTNMSLYRYVCFSDATYTNILKGTSPVESIFNNPDGTNTVRDLIARDVAQVSFVSYTNDSAGVPHVCPYPTTLPSMIDVAVTTLNDKVAVLLPTQAQWVNTNSALVQQNEETFALRVRPQGP